MRRGAWCVARGAWGDTRASVFHAPPATQHGLRPMQILAVMPLIIPSTLPYTLPATTLFATCVVYGRLAHDNEILAIKAAGINLLRVVWPAVLLGLVMSAATVALYWQVI